MNLKITIASVIFAAFLPFSAFAAEDTRIVIDNFAFSPANATVKAGTKVSFVNHDDLPHNVIDEKGAFKSKALDTDETFVFTFDKPGEFIYFCGLHPKMKGKIVVTP